jgi:hypothetical protein
MHIPIGLIVGAALLYGWLVGFWFARVLTFLVFTFIIGALVLVRDDLSPPAPLILCILGGVAAWFVSGLPTYYWRRRARMFRAVATGS